MESKTHEEEDVANSEKRNEDEINLPDDLLLFNRVDFLANIVHIVEELEGHVPLLGYCSLVGVFEAFDLGRFRLRVTRGLHLRGEIILNVDQKLAKHEGNWDSWGNT